MELNRDSIERRDFPTARRGYDREAVDRHLEEVAASAEELRQAREAAPLASEASDNVRAIVKAAESSANELRERAGAEAAAHLRQVEEVTGNMLRRSQLLQKELDRLVEDLRAAATSIVGEMRGGAASLRSELQALREELPLATADGAEVLFTETGERVDRAHEPLSPEPGGLREERTEPMEAGEDDGQALPAAAEEDAPAWPEPAPDKPSLVIDQPPGEPAAAGPEEAEEQRRRKAIPIRGRPS